MKIVFLSNYYNHHQKSFSEAIANRLGEKYYFIASSEMSASRKNFGYGLENIPCFVKQIQNNQLLFEDKRLIDNADIVIYGSAPRCLIDNRLKHNMLTFFYSERIYKNQYNYLKWPMRLVRFWNRYGKYKQAYMLCASAFTAADYAKHFTFINKTYKWGYFPETKHYDLENLNRIKNRKKILWCGRFLEWKHPDDAIIVAEQLNNEGYDFEIDFIGIGEIEEKIKLMVKQKGLDSKIKFLGSMRPECVREHMEFAGIFLFTSDFNEGWGAVLNESMNSGCAVVASHAIGSVPFLVKHKENGLVYKNGDVEDLYKKIKFLLDNPNEQARIGMNAYCTIVGMWNAEVAAERFLKFAREIKMHGYCDLYKEGPCSRAEILKNNWFKE